MGFYGILMGFNGIYDGYPLVNIQKTMERSTISNGKIHYFKYQFSIAMLNYQRVNVRLLDGLLDGLLGS
jgi:hypothetical protein